MIISCPSCKKKFEIDANLIPESGRNLQCGSCSNVWFFKPKKSVSVLEIEDNLENIKKNNIKDEIIEDKKVEISSIKEENTERQKDKALIKYEKKTRFTITNFIGYFFVLILSFVALLIILDTFEPLLSRIFPNLELILFNFYETLLDIYLFIKDLIR